MTEAESIKASDMLRKCGIAATPTDISLIACIDNKPYAYRIIYSTGSTASRVICYTDDVKS